MHFTIFYSSPGGSNTGAYGTIKHLELHSSITFLQKVSIFVLLITSGSTWSKVASGANLAIKIPLQRQIQKYPNGNVSPGSFYIYMLISTFIHISIPIIIWTVPMILESLSPSLCFYPILTLLSPSLSPLILFVNLTGIWPHFIILNLVTMVLHVLQCVMNKLYRVRV